MTVKKIGLMTLAVIFAVAQVSTLCASEKKDDHAGHDHAKHDDGVHKGHDAHGAEGPHGGALMEVGEHVAHLEMIIDHKVGKVTLYVYGKDAKTALKIRLFRGICG